MGTQCKGTPEHRVTTLICVSLQGNSVSNKPGTLISMFLPTGAYFSRAAHEARFSSGSAASSVELRVVLRAEQLK